MKADEINIAEARIDVRNIEFLTHLRCYSRNISHNPLFVPPRVPVMKPDLYVDVGYIITIV